jgi:hypothetical protein
MKHKQILCRIYLWELYKLLPKNVIDKINKLRNQEFCGNIKNLKFYYDSKTEVFAIEYKEMK